MKQRTLAMTIGFERYSKKTKRALFLEEMEQVVPWRELCALIEPYYHKTHLFNTLNNLRHRWGPPKPLQMRTRRSFDGSKNGFDRETD
jgi:hypothetical protein